MLKLKIWLKHAYILVHVCLFDSDLLVVFFGKFCLFIHLFAYLTVFVLFILLVWFIFCLYDCLFVMFYSDFVCFSCLFVVCFVYSAC